PPPSGGRRLASPAVGRDSLAPACRLASERLLHAARDGAQAALHTLARLRSTGLLRQLRHLALQLPVLLDQLRDHRVELTDEIATGSLRTPRATGLRTRWSSPAARCVGLCFLWCHF